MRQDALKEFNHYKRFGYCYDLGSLAYDYLVSEGKIPKRIKNKSKGLEYAKNEIVKEWKSDLKIASDKMKLYWRGKIDNVNQLMDEAINSKGDSVLRQKIFVYFKRWAVNDYFSRL